MEQGRKEAAVGEYSVPRQDESEVEFGRQQEGNQAL